MNFSLSSGIVQSGFRYTPVASYLSIPSAPSFNSPVTLFSSATSTQGYIGPLDMTSANPNDGKDAIVAGTWPIAMNFTTLQGVKGKSFRFVNRDSNFYSGFRNSSGETTATATTRHSVQSNTDCNYVEVYGKDQFAPWKNYANYKSFAFNYLAILGTGSTFRLQNIVSDKVGGGLLASHGVTGYRYRKLFQNFNRCDGNGKPTLDSSEASYNGHNGTPFSYITDVAILHNCFINMGREPWQIEHGLRMHVYNTTSINNGLGSAGSGQNNCVQVHDSNGIVENCIFDGSPNLMNIFTHDVTFKNCYFRWTNGASAYIGDCDKAYFSGSTTLNGRQLLFDSCYFHADYGGTVPYVTQAAERRANIQFKNCFFSTNITAIFDDQRVAGYTNVLSGTTTTNGNSKITITAPTYLSTDITNANFGCLTKGLYYGLGMGYRTPLLSSVKPNIVDALEELTLRNVPYNTPFSGITGLTTTGTFHIQDGSRVTIPITWSANNYNKTGSGSTYTILGTPSSGSTYKNTLGVRAEQDVFVNNPIVTTKILLVNFGGTSMSYISTGNWNNLPANFTTGSIQAYGNNSSSPIASLRKSDGSGLSGINVSINTVLQGEAVGANVAGSGAAAAFTQSSNNDEWTHPGSSGTSNQRSWKLTGLDTSKTYTMTLMCSAGSFLSGPQKANFQLTGVGSGGSTYTAFDQKGNSTNVMTWTFTSNVSGEATLNMINIAQGFARCCAFSLSYSE